MRAMTIGRSPRAQLWIGAASLVAIAVLIPVYRLQAQALSWTHAAAAAVIFAATLPISGALAYRYWVGAGRLRSRLRFGTLALVRAQAARRLTAERQAIITELEQAKNEYLAATKGSSF